MITTTTNIFFMTLNMTFSLPIKSYKVKDVGLFALSTEFPVLGTNLMVYLLLKTDLYFGSNAAATT